MNKLRILFAHSSCGQFKHLHQYLNEAGLAESWMLCNEAAYDIEKTRLPNLIPFKVSNTALRDLKDRIINPISISASVAAGMYPLIRNLIERYKIDIFYGHVLFGSVYPYQKDLNVPVVYYVEYPGLEKATFRSSLYNPAVYQLHEDRYFQMLVNQSISDSSAAIAPSLYARSLFSREQQRKIIVQTDGFYSLNFCKQIKSKGKFAKRKIGFCARYLTYSKGIEDFIAIAQLLLTKNIDVEFVVIGEEKNFHSCEMNYLKSEGKSNLFSSFLRYLIDKYHIPGASITVFGYQQFDRYVEALQGVDIFLYPLREGSSNWGFFHLLSIGAVIVASDRCYIPEVIRQGVNGYMLSLNCYDTWVDTIIYLLNHEEKREAISIAAYETSKLYELSKIGKEYVGLLKGLTTA